MARHGSAAVLAALALISGYPGRSLAADPLPSALTSTRLLLDARLRWEFVDQDGFNQNADAVTLRARLGFETGKAWDTSLLAEGSFNYALLEDYNSTVNGRTQYPVVADPSNQAVNRLLLTNSSLPHTVIVLGRQVINLDDQRFVGDSNWRQNQQTYDAARVTIRPVKPLTIDVSYANQVNRVYGKDSPQGQYTGSNYFLNVGWDTPYGKISAFDYLLDFNQAPKDSSGTAGLRFAGEHRAGDRALGYSASYAHQQDRADNPLHYSADYYAAELVGTMRKWSLGAGMELLDGSGTKGFATPLATLHKFNGWADKFLTTPVNGLDDWYGLLRYAAGRVGRIDSLTATAVYHDFQADRVSLHYGDEIDLLLAAKLKKFSALVKYASYNADHFATSTQKFWLEFDYVY